MNSSHPSTNLTGKIVICIITFRSASADCLVDGRGDCCHASLNVELFLYTVTVEDVILSAYRIVGTLQ